MPDTLTAIATSAQGAFVATAGRLPVIYVVNGSGVNQVITIDTLEHGLLSASVNINCNLSPDGKQLVYGLSDGPQGNLVVKLAQLTTATPALLLASEGDERFSTPVWFADSQRLATVKTTPGDSLKGELMTLSLSGELTKVYGDDVEDVFGVSADGTRAYIARTNPEAFSDFIYSIVNLADGTIQDIDLDRNANDTVQTGLNYKFGWVDGAPLLVYNLSPSPYLQVNHPTVLRVADADTGAAVANIIAFSSVSDIQPDSDFSHIAFTTRNFDDNGQIAGSAIWVAKLDGTESPLNILPTQEGVPDFNVVSWTGDDGGIFVMSGPSTVEMVGLDGSHQVIINQVDSNGAAVGHSSDSGGVQAFSAAGAEVLLNAPYVHQLRNTPDDFDGNWACGPTSAVMLMAGYGLLDSRNDIYGKQPTQFGFYVARQYTSHTNFTFSRSQADPRGRPSTGGYGSCTNNGEAWGSLVAQFIKNHGLGASSITPSENLVKSHLRQRKLVVLGTTVKGFGHVLLVKGITSDGKLICNDPYWRKAGAGDDVYAWWELGRCPFMISVDRAVPDAAPPPTQVTVAPPTPAFVPPPPPAPSTFEAGQGLSDGLKKRFMDAYNRNGGAGALGKATGPAVQQIPPDSPGYVQNFKGGSLGEVSLFLDDRHDQSNAVPVPILQPAFLIRNPILQKYRDYGGSGGPLGAILSDEYVNQQNFRQINFEGGYITWDETSSTTHDAFLWPDNFNSWKAEYYNNAGLAGAPSFLRDEPQINYEWGTGSPEGGRLGILANYFSVRWTRTVSFDLGIYTFTVACDDGFRFMVNGANVGGADPNQFWAVSAGDPHTFTLSLQGDASLTLEYFEAEGGALAKLSWVKIGG